MLYFFLFLFGLLIGSFLNVVSLRYRPGQRLLDLKIIGGRSKCPVCRKNLEWHELIPLLSFFIQFGKCRACGAKLSWQYPIVELLSGLIFFAVPWRLSNFQFPISNFQSITQSLNDQLLISVVWIFIFLLFLVFSIIDFRHSIIPDQINLLLAFLGIVLTVLQTTDYWLQTIDSFLGHYASLFEFNLINSLITNNSITLILNHFFAALVAMVFFGGIILLSRGRAMGWGDFKLAGALGLIFGWPDTLIIIVLSFVIGSVFAAPFLITGKKKMKDAVPFGPFLAASSALVFFFGFQIMDGYFRMFGL